MPLDKSGAFRMNPGQASIMGAPAPGGPSNDPNADPNAASSATTVTLSANGDGSYHVITDAGDGQPPQESDAPDFETAMSQAGASFGEGKDDDASAAAPIAAPMSAADKGAAC